MPELDLDGSDTTSLDDTSGPLNWRPTRHFDDHDTSLSFSDSGTGPGLVSLSDHDNSLSFSDAGLLVKLNFNGADSFGFAESSLLKFPIPLHDASDTIGLDDTTGSAYGIPVRLLHGSDSFSILELPVLYTAGYQIDESDAFSFLEFFNIVLVPGPNNKIGTDTFALTDSGTLGVAKAGSDNFVINEFSCICWQFNKAKSDSFGFSENPLLWINNRRLTPPSTLPGGHGARFNAIIRWNKVESIKLSDAGYRVDDAGFPIPDSTCCVSAVGSGWSGLIEWADLLAWSDLGE
jgi:hypothetical protein